MDPSVFKRFVREEIEEEEEEGQEGNAISDSVLKKQNFIKSVI